MKFYIHDKLVHQVDSPQGTLYKLIKTYTCSMVVLLLLLALIWGDTSKINLYLLINICTVTVMTWFIRKSFIIQSKDKHVILFRISLFLLLNSSLFSMSGGLGIIDRDTASILAAIAYTPAMIMIVYSYDRFIKYANNSYKEAINLSLTDELTGLPNRRHLNIKLREMEDRQGTICIADIDHFKRINDTYGHEVGDKVLRSAGLRLSNFVDDKTFIARSGGEEFAILVFDNIHAENIIRKIKSSTSASCNGSIGITLSIGVAIKNKEQHSSLTITAADQALYKAKHAGRNRIIYAPRQ